MYSIKWLNHNKKYFHEIKCRNAIRSTKTYIYVISIYFGMVALEILSKIFIDKSKLFIIYFLRFCTSFFYEYYV